MNSEFVLRGLLTLCLLIVGASFTYGGWRLVALDGSLYYLGAGVLMLASALLVWRKSALGILVYATLSALTLIWALYEVGFAFWLLLPRLGLPFGILLLMVIWARLSFLDTVNAGSKTSCRLYQSGALGSLALGALVLMYAFSIDGRFSLNGSIGDVDPSMWSTDAVQPSVESDPSQWPHYGNTQAGTRFVSSDQINTSNVQDLEVAWTYRTGVTPEAYPGGTTAFAFQATPIKVGDTLYVCSGNNAVHALDPETGEPNWVYDPKIDTTGIFMFACRGVSYHEDAEPSHPKLVSSAGSDSLNDLDIAEAPAAASGLESHAGSETTKDCRARIITATLDARLIALDAKTGELCEGFGQGGQVSLLAGMGEAKPGYYLVSSPPAIVGDLAVVGGFVLDNMSIDEPSGVVRGYSVKTGELMWVWDSGRPLDAGRWQPGEAFTRGSPNAWSLFSADEKLGMVYVPTGNTTPDYYGVHRSEAQDKHSTSVVALDAATGDVVWSFQTVHHDLWDYDVPSQPTLLDIPVGGESIPALIQPTKQGELFMLNRITGKPIAAVEQKSVPKGDIPGERYSPTQPVSVGIPSLNPRELAEADMWGATALDQLWCRIEFKKLRYEGRFTPPGLDASLQWPGNMGVMNWGSITVDPERGLLATNSSNAPLVVQLVPREEMPEGEQIFFDENYVPLSPQIGTPYGVKTERPMLSPLGIPCNAPPWGKMSMINLKTRELVWQRPLGTTKDNAPFGIAMPGAFTQGGSILTKGGLIFVGATQDSYLRAFDVATGEELWKGRLPAGGQATPMSFVSEEDGKQYVVIAAGGHQYMQTQMGDYLVAYRLPN